MVEAKLKPIHPGEVLVEEFLKPFGLDEHELAVRTKIDAARLKGIVERTKPVGADEALRLGKYFGVSPQFWLGLQSDYDLDVAKDRLGDVLEKEIVPIAA